MKSIINSTLILLCFTLLPACKSQTSRVDQGKRKDVIAEVGDSLITESDFVERLKHIGKFRGKGLLTEDQKKDLINDMVDFELLFQTALKQELHLKDESIRRRMVNVYLKEMVGSKAKTTEDEAKAFYEKNKDLYDQIRASHILISTQKYEEPEAKKRAEKVAKALKDGETFVKLVRDFSDDAGTNKKNGDLGLFNRKKGFDKDFTDGAFALKRVGEISKPVKSPYGYHIIRLMADRRGFMVNKAEVMRRVNKDKNKQVYDALMKKIQSDISVKVHYDRLDKLQPAPPTAANTPKK